MEADGVDNQDYWKVVDHTNDPAHMTIPPQTMASLTGDLK